ncbi:hypothetical protein Tco_1529669, partial [Tanacetum coccineum]
KFKRPTRGVKIYFNKLVQETYSRCEDLLQQIGAIRGTYHSIYQDIRMAGASQRGHPGDDIEATPGGIVRGIAGTSTDGGDTGATPSVTAPSVTREQIEGHLSAFRSPMKEHNSRGNVSLIRLNFEDLEDRTEVRTVVTRKEVGDVDLRKPFKEAVKTPLTQRIIEFAGPEFKMPANIKLYDRTTDPEDYLGRFSSAANSGEWPMPVCCRMFQQTLDGSAREITRIARKANETLVAFKERWIMETGFIVGVPEVMKISSFMDAHKCPELAKRYSDKVPKTVDEMMVRLDDFVRSEEAFANTELPKGEVSEASKKYRGHVSRREDRFLRGGYRADRRRNDGRNTFNVMDSLVPYRPQTHRGDYQVKKAVDGSRIGEAQPPDQRCEAKKKGERERQR